MLPPLPRPDSCGVAGGHPATEDCEFGGCYMNTSNAVLGDMGSKKLPKQSYNVSWKAGTNVEVSWNIMANHGGGKDARACPLAYCRPSSPWRAQSSPAT